MFKQSHIHNKKQCNSKIKHCVVQYKSDLQTNGQEKWSIHIWFKMLHLQPTVQKTGYHLKKHTHSTSSQSMCEKF